MSILGIEPKERGLGLELSAELDVPVPKVMKLVMEGLAAFERKENSSLKEGSFLDRETNFR